MNINGEAIGIVLGILTIVGLFVGSVKYLVTMKEHLKTLFRKVESCEKEIEDKDKDIKSLKIHCDQSIKEVRDHSDNSIKDVSARVQTINDSMKDSHSNLSTMIQQNYIKVLERKDDH